MPQLDPAVFLPQIFWLAVIFGLIYLFMSLKAAPKIAEVLERRQDRIVSDLEEAEKLQAQADAAREAHEKALEDARAKAASTVAAKREAIKADVEAEYNKLSEKLGGEAAAAEEKISAAKDQALEQVRAMAADVCKDVVASVSGLDLDDKTVAKAVDAKFADMKETA
ncbi:F0F1 ATP synthase subunit B' [Paremcibacter congregatus]|jgi:F-type H+-transporting ATPase subunit b|uniref:ATP synthase subunit b n=1 Tax=Paremcibacter congregatus TaxID=2043170 RepID=A0A2G4YTH4_9PROT|nr:F0F1 ATP synthase subunit B' [Paremcibacter congregatus]PHZ85638.1 F0F1 ATP synthase subunit B' [Paremcibacter congregatus]QDE26598.1 F0F1 ATP synthase subunit B' [Paremcibacter congregatus]|tara:strand:- start:5754 stop:6254 length:501 start_codon:yes stop_codon:yes gene_type:complete